MSELILVILIKTYFDEVLNRGEVSLLEALDAQRTYNEVQSQYIETLFNHAAALVELERDAGIWDIEL